MGSRPEGGPSDDQLKVLAHTLNEIGRQTIAFGVRLAPHPHIWGPMERERDLRRVMELTDPKYVLSHRRHRTFDPGRRRCAADHHAIIFRALLKCI